MNDQDEMFEAATETPAFLGCPAHMPKTLPSGFDGTEPGAQGGEGVPPSQRKHTMDFGRFHVTRAAIPGRTILTFRRKQEHLAEFGTVVPGRIIVAQIYKQDDCGEGVSNHFVVNSCMPGESQRVLFSGQTWVSMSKTEKIVYKMVKCNIKETQRRHVTRKRKRDATKQEEK